MLTHNQDLNVLLWKRRLLPTTWTEFRILWTLSRSPGSVFSRFDLLSGVYPWLSELSKEAREIDAHIHRIRFKTDKELIITSYANSPEYKYASGYFLNKELWYSG